MSIIGQFIFSLFFTIIFLVGGIYTLLSSPYLFRMDRKRNRCTWERKFTWQTKYKVKTLCKLSEVKKAIRTEYHEFGRSIIGGNLCLKLRSGKDIVIFKSEGRSDISDLDIQAYAINRFLNNNDEQYTIEKSFDFLVCLFLFLGGVSLFGTIALLFKM